jgi:hypothetical protein
MGAAINKAISSPRDTADRRIRAATTTTAVEAEAQRKTALANDLLRQISERERPLEKAPHHLMTPQMRLAAVKDCPREHRFINPIYLENDEVLLSHVDKRWHSGFREQVRSFSELKKGLIERTLECQGDEPAQGESDSAGDGSQRPRQR